jgi:hypothetical protein
MPHAPPPAANPPASRRPAAVAAAPRRRTPANAAAPVTPRPPRAPRAPRRRAPPAAAVVTPPAVVNFIPPPPSRPVPAVAAGVQPPLEFPAPPRALGPDVDGEPADLAFGFRVEWDPPPTPQNFGRLPEERIEAILETFSTIPANYIGDDCPLCCRQFEAAEEFCHCPSFHKIHRSCLTDHLMSHHECPLCRITL